MPIRTSALAALLAAATLLAACSGAGQSPAATAAPTVQPPSSAPASAATRVVVTLTDALRIEPATMTVPAGVPVTFVVTNAGALDHEFFLGDEAAQAEHEQEMQQGGMAHDEPMGIGVKPGVTKELTVTFATAGQTLAGCHVQGHYMAGMKAVITIQ